MLTRRTFIQTGLCAGASTSVLAGYPQTVHAASSSGYKALVSIWLLGGMDGHDVVIPLAPETHGVIKNARTGLFADHEAAGTSREIPNLLPLGDTNQAAHNGQKFGFAPELTDMHTYFERGEMAVVGSVGPLLRPINRLTYDSSTHLRPRRLFSHNDQRLTWMTFRGEGANRGWGGAFANAVYRASSVSNPDFLSVYFGGEGAFLNGRNVRPFSLGQSGEIPPLPKDHLRGLMRGGNRDKMDEVLDIFNEHTKSSSVVSDNLYKRDIIAANERSVSLASYYREVIKHAPAFDVPFPGTKVGKQLKAIAQSISVRDRIGVPRQVFSTALGGWDTHNSQAGSISGLLTDLNEAIVAFRAAMKQLGVWDDVTVFTGADFGRTLVENGSGTDHGWGGHQFVLGGSVKGKQIAGRMPVNWNFRDKSDKGEFVSSDAALIPSTSVEQYAASLGEWFGLTPSELDVALPNLKSFPAGSLDLFK